MKGPAMTIYQHIRHPHIAARQADRPVRVVDQLPRGSAVNRFNTRVAIAITQVVGSIRSPGPTGGRHRDDDPRAVVPIVGLQVAWPGILRQQAKELQPVLACVPGERNLSRYRLPACADLNVRGAVDVGIVVGLPRDRRRLVL